MPLYPQVLLNVRVAERIDVDSIEAVRTAREALESELGERGRIVLRASGTEPVIRVMVEGIDAEQIQDAAERLAEVVKAAAA